MTNEVIKADNLNYIQNIEIEKTTKWVVDRRDKIKDIMKKTMTKGVDFGIVPGCPKPSLMKSGAEKLCSVFMLSPVIKVEEIGERPEKAYRIVVDLVHQNTGAVVASGVGEASSDEEKYKWRNAVCQEEYDNTDADKRRIKYKRDGSQLKQVRTEPADIANTILKMAKKRALIDAVLTATAASDIFTQDTEEDMPEEITAPTTPMPKPISEKQETNKVWVGLIKSFIAPKDTSHPYQFKGDDLTFSCFESSIAEAIIEISKLKKQIKISYYISVKGKYTNNIITDIEEVGNEEKENA